MKKTEKSTASTLAEINFLQDPTFDEDGVQVTSAIGRDGKEYPDPVPTAPPVGYTNPPDLMTMIRTMIHSESLRQQLAIHDEETFEEADDFDIPDDPADPLTPYEQMFYPPDEAKPAEAAGVAPTPPAAPAETPPEVLDTSVVADTSATTPAKKQNPAANQTAKPLKQG